MTETDRIRRLYDDRAATLEKSLGIGERLLLGGFRQEYGGAAERRDHRGQRRERSHLPFYSPAVTRAVGVDLSWEMLQHAGERALHLGIPVALVQADAEALPFPDASFDTVAISLALCTIPDPVKALLEPGRLAAQVVDRDARARAINGPATRQCRGLFHRSMSAPSAAISTGTPSAWHAHSVSRSTRPESAFDSVRLVVARPPASAMLPSPHAESG